MNFAPLPIRLLLAPALALCVPASFGAEGAPSDKSGYHLFRPTPTHLMREMSTDRPDKTESPYTVDAGHFQFEMDALSYVSDKEKIGGVHHRVDALSVAAINLKLGLCNRSDLQLVVEPYQRVYERAGGVRTPRQGFGDLTLRYKYNLWGNDSGRTALAAMPYVKFPTAQDDLGNDHVEGGLIVPLAVALPGEFGLGLMTQFDAVRDSDDGGYHAEFVNTITLSRDLVGKLAGYVEFFSAVSTERGSDWVGTFDCGLTYGLTDDIQLDAGVNIGVTDAADDWNPFVGLSWRF